LHTYMTSPLTPGLLCSNACPCGQQRPSISTIRLAALIQYRSATDGQTDRQKDRTDVILSCTIIYRRYYTVSLTRSQAVARIADRTASQQTLTFREIFVRPLGISHTKPRTKFEVSSSSRFGDMFDHMPKIVGVT